MVQVFVPHAEPMLSSWYGDESGPKMANGHLYNKMAMTVAHRSLPFGTKLLLINPSNNHSVIVTVTDRGPYIKGRSLDCSEGVALKLGFRGKGLANLVTVRLNNLPGQPPRTERLQLAKLKVNQSRTQSSLPNPSSLCFSTGTFAPLHYDKDSPFIFDRTAFAQKPIYVCQAGVIVGSKSRVEFEIAKGPRRIRNMKPSIHYQPIPELVNHTQFYMNSEWIDSLP